MTSRERDIYFSFGLQLGIYLLDTPKKFKQRMMPSAIIERMTNVSKVHWAVTGDNGYAAFMYKGSVSEPGEWKWTSTALQRDLPEAASFLQNCGPELDHADISMTLGPGKSYVICVPTKNMGCWNGLEPALEKKLYDIDNVRHVALGVGGAHGILYGNYIDWNLKGNYDTLDRILLSIGQRRISYLALSAWRCDEFFMLMADGTIHFQVHRSVEDDLKSLLESCTIPMSYHNDLSYLFQKPPSPQPAPNSTFSPTRFPLNTSPRPMGQSMAQYSNQQQLMAPLADSKFSARVFLKEVLTNSLGGFIGGVLTTAVTGLGGCNVM